LAQQPRIRRYALLQADQNCQRTYQQRMRRDDLIFMIFVFVLGIMPTGLLLLGPVLLK
jgi:hypothetical protein